MQTRRLAAAFAVSVLVLALVTTGAVARFGLEKAVPDKLETAKQHTKHALEEVREAQKALDGDEPGLARKLTDKFTGLFHRAEPSDGGGATDAIRGAAEKTRAAITPESYEQWMHRLKVAVGAEDPTLWERVRSVFGRSEEPIEQLRHAFGSETPTEEGLWERVKHAFAPAEKREPGFFSRLKSSLGFQPAATESPASMTSTEFMHKVKVALGVEDETLWEKIRSTFEPHKSLMDRAFSENTQEAIQDSFSQIKQSLARLDPTHRDTVLEKIKKAVGLQPPSFMENIRSRFGTGIQETLETAGTVAGEAIDKADEMIRGNTYDTVMHKLKMAVHAEDPTLWEKIQYSLQPRETYGDKIKHFFGRDTGVTRGKLMQRLKEVVADMDPRQQESYTTKFKKAVGLEEPSLLDKIREKLGGGYEAAKETAEEAQEYLTGTSYDDFVQKVQSVVGGDYSVWDKIKNAVKPEPGILDKVKGALGRSVGYTKEGYLNRIESALEDWDPTRRDTFITQVKKAVGIQQPGLVERIRDRFSTGARDTLETAGAVGREAVDKADELLRGSTFDDALHRVKMALGAEDPTVTEKIMNALQPSQSIGDKMRHLFGRDTGVTRTQIVDRIKDSLSGYDPHKQESYMGKIKNALGIEEEQPSFFGRAKEKIGKIFRGPDPVDQARDVLEQALTTSKGSIDSLIGKLRSSTTENREELFEELRKVIAKAGQSTQKSMTDLFKAFGGKDESHAGVADKMSAVYHSLQNVADSWMKQVSEAVKYPTTRGQYLLQSSRQDKGRSMFYVNDNGQERVDVTGEDVSEKSFDKLKCINSFREELNLDPYDSVPDTASVQIHTVKRPHVLIKTMRVIEGNKFSYTYDDGEESLTVEWHDATNDKVLTAAEQQHLLHMFRQEHGLSVRPQHQPKVRSSLIKQYKDDL